MSDAEELGAQVGEEFVAADPDEAEPEAAEPQRRRRPWWQKLLIGLGVVIASLVALALALYLFGSMWFPSSEAKAAYAQIEAAGQAPPIERQFHIPIPGCVCHSDNPVPVMEHSNRRIRQCMDCHGGS